MSDVTVEEFMSGRAPKTPPPWTQEERDAAKRASDILNEHIAGLDFDVLKHFYIAIRLSDGGSDEVLYDTKRAAVQHQVHEHQCAYIAFRNLVGGTTPREMLRVLRFHRMAYDSGMRLVDPEDVNGGPDLLPTAPLLDAMSGRVRPRLR